MDHGFKYRKGTMTVTFVPRVNTFDSLDERIEQEGVVLFCMPVMHLESSMAVTVSSASSKSTGRLSQIWSEPISAFACSSISV